MMVSGRASNRGANAVLVTAQEAAQYPGVRPGVEIVFDVVQVHQAATAEHGMERPWGLLAVFAQKMHTAAQLDHDLIRLQRLPSSGWVAYLAAALERQMECDHMAGTRRQDRTDVLRIGAGLHAARAAYGHAKKHRTAEAHAAKHVGKQLRAHVAWMSVSGMTQGV